MKHIGRKINSTLAACLLTLVALTHPAGLKAQEAPASVHGHVQNAAGVTVTKGEIRFTTDKAADEKTRKYAYTFEIQPNGDFKGADIKPGNYLVVAFQEGKSVDFFDNQTFAPGEDKLLNFDMSRKEYVDKMTPEEKKALEEYKKKNAEVVAGNAKIANLNTLLTQARSDTKAGNYDAAITAMQQATTQKPDEAILWVTLGDAQLGSGDAAAKAAKTAGGADTTSKQKYADAAASYKKAIDTNAASKKPNPETAAAAYNQLGQSLSKSGDTKDAADAYEQAAKTAPASAGMYYFNEAATLYNTGKLDEAAAAADKAIAADPKRADAYYIKAQALIPKATVDPKTQKITAPPGCVEAYQQYLELAPEGPRAEEVKGILTGIGEKIKTSYKAGKK